MVLSVPEGVLDVLQVAVDRATRFVGLTLHNPNPLPVQGPEIRIKPVSTRQTTSGSER